MESFRLICSGGRNPHPVKELCVLHRRHGRPDVALMWLRAGEPERAAAAERFEPGWDAEGSHWSYDGTARRSHRKTPVRVVPGRDGGQVLHLPACVDCGRGRGQRLSVEKLAQQAEARGHVLDVSVFLA